MNEEQFFKLMQRYVANIATSGSTLRNQGDKDVAKNARQFLSQLDLMMFRRIKPNDYPECLNRWTEELKKKLPKGARNWGTARKALNVFLVQVFMNKHLVEKYGLKRFGDVLETPLDSQATSRMRKLAGRGRLPRWDSIKRLSQGDSLRYQEFAAVYAQEQGIPRACLDIIIWRPKKAVAVWGE